LRYLFSDDAGGRLGAWAEKWQFVFFFWLLVRADKAAGVPGSAWKKNPRAAGTGRETNPCIRLLLLVLAFLCAFLSFRGSLLLSLSIGSFSPGFPLHFFFCSRVGRWGFPWKAWTLLFAEGRSRPFFSCAHIFAKYIRLFSKKTFRRGQPDVPFDGQAQAVRKRFGRLARQLPICMIPQCILTPRPVSLKPWATNSHSVRLPITLIERGLI